MAISAIKLKNGRICGPVPGVYTGPSSYFWWRNACAGNCLSTSRHPKFRKAYDQSWQDRELSGLLRRLEKLEAKYFKKVRAG